MFARFIHRPVLSIVVSAMLTLLGLLALAQLPMSLFPRIAPPEVNVTVEYPGANAETVTKAAIAPLERSINGVPGMKYMASDCGNDGVGIIQVIFETGANPDLAAVNVQTRVMDVMGILPPEVVKNGVLIGKEENSILMYINIFSNDPTTEEKFLYNFADLRVLEELKRIPGVGFADIMGAKEYAMRIWLKPDKMLAYDISTEEVLETLEEQNIEAAPGKLGISSEKKPQATQYVLKYTGRFVSEEEYANIPLKSTPDGQVLRIKDIADVEFSTAYYDVKAKYKGRPSAAIVLKQVPGSNASEVIAQVKDRLAELKETMFLEDMDYEISYDISSFLDASVREVIRTLVEAFILVSLVVLLFLGDVRSTIISAIAIPVSLIGALLFMQLFGFSLNLITLFALVLSIGIVVDNAIVVVEAVHAKMETESLPPMQATESAMHEISGAIIAITLVMSAVFIPVSFLPGPTGIFYRQFSLTLAIAIVLSGVVALTLTPSLCAVLLKNNHGKEQKSNLFNRVVDGFNRWYERRSKGYQRLVGAIVNRRAVTFAVLILFCLGTGVLGNLTPTGFIPAEDMGTFYGSVNTPPGATLERTEAVVDEVQRICESIPGVASVSSLAGTSFLSDGTGATYGTLLINLDKWEERGRTADEIIAEVYEKTNHIVDAEMEFFPPPPVPGYGNAAGFELKLLDKTGGGDLRKMEEVANQFIEDLIARPEIRNAFSFYNAGFPQYLLHVDADKAATKGVSASNAMGALQALLGSEYATNFIRFGRTYKVMVQALPEYRANPEDLMKIHVKNEEGEMVSIANFIEMEKVLGVEQVTRYNMFNSAEINGEPAPGYSSGEAIAAIREVAAAKLPEGYDIAWSGMTYDEVAAGNEAMAIFFVSLLFVYLLLSAQYESFLLPLPVILSLPPGIFGVFLFLQLMGLQNNIYAQVAMIMLIGLLGKNAILIVEFAAMKHKQGKSVTQAAIEGAAVRLRPILMTSFAFIAGLIPLMLASGAGAVANRTIGTAAAGGMLIGTVFGVVLIPGLYFIFGSLSEKFVKRAQAQQIEITEETPLTELEEAGAGK